MGGDPGREKAGAGVAFGLILVLLVLCGGGYAAAYVGSSDKIPRHTTIAGVEVGGLTPGAAEARLRRDLAERAETTFGVVVGDQPAPVRPSEAGLGVDYAASVAQVVSGRSWHPKRLWSFYTGGEDVAPVTTLDEGALDDWIATMDTRLGTPPREGAVYFDGTRIVTTQPRDGVALDVDGTRAALQAAYAAALAGEPGDPVDLPTVTRQPAIDTSDVQRAVRRFANPAMSGPVTLDFDRSQVRVTPEQYAGALSLVPTDGRLVPTVDAGSLDSVVEQAISGSAAPVPATVRLVHGRPEVIPDEPGITYHRADVADALRRVVQRKAGHRTIPVRSHPARADFRTADARALKIVEQVSTSTTSIFPAKELARTARLVDGTVLRPGETFSFNGTVGGYSHPAAVSQLATAIFDAMFLAGLKDVEHTPAHSYVEGHPVGRDATVSSGSVDLRFANDSPHGVLISAHVTPTTVTVSMWSTKTWDITTSTGDPQDVTHPGRRVLHTRDCEPSAGRDGFDVDVTRTFHRPGTSNVDHSETFHTHYAPVDQVVCKR